MLNNPSPLPLKYEPLAKNTLPVNVEPLIGESTTNPLSGLTEAVILPLAILVTSCDNADNGMLNNPAPLPLNCDADTGTFTTNPKFGDIDAVAEPLAILTESPDMFEIGISNIFLPLPLNEPLKSLALTESLTNRFPLTIVSPINLISAGTTIELTKLIVPAIIEWNSQL